MTDSQAFDRLTPRERECLSLVARHLGSKEIARELGISPHTVDGYLDEARRKLGAATRRDAARRLAAAPLSNSGGQASGAPDGVRVGSSEVLSRGHEGHVQFDAELHLGVAGAGAAAPGGEPRAAGDGPWSDRRDAPEGERAADRAPPGGDRLHGHRDRGRDLVSRLEREFGPGGLKAARLTIKTTAVAVGFSLAASAILVGAHSLLLGTEAVFGNPSPAKMARTVE